MILLSASDYPDGSGATEDKYGGGVETWHLT